MCNKNLNVQKSTIKYVKTCNINLKTAFIIKKVFPVIMVFKNNVQTNKLGTNKNQLINDLIYLKNKKNIRITHTSY